MILATVALALLDFAGAAALVPPLLVVLDETAALRPPGLGWLYQAAHSAPFGPSSRAPRLPASPSFAL